MWGNVAASDRADPRRGVGRPAVGRVGRRRSGSGTGAWCGCANPQVLFATPGRAQRGVLICGTGIGMCIAANKVKGVRAAPCHDSITAEMSRRHNDANVLCLSADLLGEELIERMLRIWLQTEFESGRHARRVEKITRFEQQGPDALKG